MTPEEYKALRGKLVVEYKDMLERQPISVLSSTPIMFDFSK